MESKQSSMLIEYPSFCGAHTSGIRAKYNVKDDLWSMGITSSLSNFKITITGGDIGRLCDSVVEDVRELTGYGRVMVYKFHEDEQSEVVAKIRQSDLKPYLGLHYLATNIPQSSWFLFMQNKVRIICDCCATPIKVIQDEEWRQLLCLVGSTLQLPHGCHAQYMANMGTIASVVMVAIINGIDEEEASSPLVSSIMNCPNGKIATTGPSFGQSLFSSKRQSEDGCKVCPFFRAHADLLACKAYTNFGYVNAFSGGGKSSKEEIESHKWLHRVFIKLLHEIDSCLKALEDVLDAPAPSATEDHSFGWAPFLIVKGLHAIAKLYEGGISMELIIEEAIGLGALREWFTLVCREIFNPQNALFDYVPMIDGVLACTFFMQLAGKSISSEDVQDEDFQDADSCAYSSCKKILDMDEEVMNLDALGLTFVIEVEELESRKVVEPCTSVAEQVKCFDLGFSNLLVNSIHQQFLRALDPEDMDLMLLSLMQIERKLGWPMCSTVLVFMLSIEYWKEFRCEGIISVGRLGLESISHLLDNVVLSLSTSHYRVAIVVQEGLEIDKDALKRIVSKSDGSLWDAEMTFNQLSLLG
eukprot:Gb_09643 [translate_table: standard]